MKYDKKYYTNNGFIDIKECVVEQVWACDCPFDKRLFITRDKVYATFVSYTLWDKKSGLKLKTADKLKDLKKWFLKGGKKAYLKVIKNNLANYQQRKLNYQKLLEALK